MRIGVIGCKSLSHADAKAFAVQYMAELRVKYQNLCVVTVREDILGRHVRNAARRLNIRRRTLEQSRHEDQHNSNELVIGQLMWNCQRIVALDDGYVGYASIAQEIANRMSKPIRVVDIS